MADGGASELVMLVTGLLTAGIVASLLVASWGSLAEIVGDTQTQIQVDSKTRASLASDPMQIAWDQATCNLTIHIQNSGELRLKMDNIGAIVNGTPTSVSGSQLIGSAIAWTSGEVAEFYLCPTGLNLATGQETPLIIIVQSEEYSGDISGKHSFSEVIRIA
ncbi:MAG: hypothetical protein QF440_04360 [Candidatus Thalassarchaeaceae archaeon]|nr:hypothetical protein [Candidatus Thalassarchaeaceae archaeon]